MERYEFGAEIGKHPDMNATYIEFPYDVEEVFGTRGRIKVQVTFDGHPYQGSLAPMGGDCHLLGLVQKVRKAIYMKPGDMLSVVLQPQNYACLSLIYNPRRRNSCFLFKPFAE